MSTPTNMKLVSLFIFALTFTLTAPAFAKELIVDGKNPAAKDDNPGTLEAPFKTIQAALDAAQPGDTVPGARRRLSRERQVQAQRNQRRGRHF